MELSEFRNEFLAQTAAWAAADGNFRHAAFVEYAASRLEEAEEVSDFHPCYYRGTGSRKRSLAIDGYALDEADNSIRLFLAEFSTGPEPETLTQTQAKATFARLAAFVEDAADGRIQSLIEESSPAHDAALLLRESVPSATRIRFYLLTDGVLSSRVRDWPEGEIRGIPLEFHIWDITRFHRVFESRAGRDELEVDFTTLVANGLPCLAASVDSAKYRAYLCVVPGKALANIYDLYGSRLLEGNVRSFLTTRGKINKAIRNTILNEPQMFFAYNNGIAATASNAVIENTALGLRLLSATDLQIVNGGQTTASLALALRDEADLDHIFIQMKLSVVDAESSGQIVPLVSRYANSQNKVSDADFFSNHEFHRRFEQLAKRIWAPATGGSQHETHWFYERARGQYINEQANLTPSARRRFLEVNPRDQVIVKTDLAKYENVWRQLPHIVSYGAQKNFLSFASYASDIWEKNPDKINDEYFRSCIVKAILFRRTEKIVSHEPWFAGGYRANIVAYTLSKLSQLVESNDEQRAIDFRGIWSKQALSETLEKQIRLIAKAVFQVIVNPEGGFQNVTEWCKKELCWKRVANLDVPISAEFTEELADREDEKSARRSAQADQHTISGIEAQAEVVRLGAEEWAKLKDWALERNLLSPTDHKILTVAAAIPRKLPNSFQSLRLLEIRGELKTEGFRA